MLHTFKDSLLPHFCGFYETLIDGTNDCDLEYNLFNDPDAVNDKIMEALKNNLFDHMDYTGYMESVSKKYCQSVEGYLHDQGLPSVSILYKALHSPKEYNFYTDTVECEITISTEDLILIKNLINENETKFSEYIEEHHKSRSGFWSFLSDKAGIWLQVLEEMIDPSFVAFQDHNPDHDYAIYRFLSFVLELDNEKQLNGEPVYYHVYNDQYETIGQWTEFLDYPKILESLKEELKKEGLTLPYSVTDISDLEGVEPLALV